MLSFLFRPVQKTLSFRPLVIVSNSNLSTTPSSSTIDPYFTNKQREELCKKLNIQSKSLSLDVAEVRNWRKNLQNADKITVGLVPTMGALHAGHVALMKEARKSCDVVCASIFVNPGQFAPHEDFKNYPRNVPNDVKMMLDNGVDNIFIPSQNVMYPGTTYGQVGADVRRTAVVPKGVDHISEGRARPGFFTGVATVVAKLFNIMQPTHAFFGQKDGLQVMVVRQLVNDLNFPLKIVVVPTLREADGLALSSRNIYLNADQRKIAPHLSKALFSIQDKFAKGNRSYVDLQNIAATEWKPFTSTGKFKVEYLSIADAVSGEELDSIEKLPNGNIMVSAAIHFGNCRLIDNVLLGIQS